MTWTAWLMIAGVVLAATAALGRDSESRPRVTAWRLEGALIATVAALFIWGIAALTGSGG